MKFKKKIKVKKKTIENSPVFHWGDVKWVENPSPKKMKKILEAVIKRGRRRLVQLPFSRMEETFLRNELYSLAFINHCTSVVLGFRALAAELEWNLRQRGLDARIVSISAVKGIRRPV